MEASSISWSDLERVVFNIMWYCVKEWWCFFLGEIVAITRFYVSQLIHNLLITCWRHVLCACSHSADKISGFRSKTQLVHYIQYEQLSHIPGYHIQLVITIPFYFMWVPNYTLIWSKSCRDGEGFGLRGSLPQALVNIIHILHGSRATLLNQNIWPEVLGKPCSVMSPDAEGGAISANYPSTAVRLLLFPEV